MLLLSSKKSIFTGLAVFTATAFVVSYLFCPWFAWGSITDNEVFLLRTPEELFDSNPFDDWKNYLAPEELDQGNPFDDWKSYIPPEELDQGNPFDDWKGYLAPEEIDQGNPFNDWKSYRLNKSPPKPIIVPAKLQAQKNDAKKFDHR
jgi:hypothetical protein